MYLVVDDTVGPPPRHRPYVKLALTRRNKNHHEDLIGYAESEPITTKSVYPLGAILQDKTTKQIYLVQNNMRHTILA